VTEECSRFEQAASGHPASGSMAYRRFRSNALNAGQLDCNSRPRGDTIISVAGARTWRVVLTTTTHRVTNMIRRRGDQHVADLKGSRSRPRKATVDHYLLACSVSKQAAPLHADDNLPSFRSPKPCRPPPPCAAQVECGGSVCPLHHPALSAAACNHLVLSADFPGRIQRSPWFCRTEFVEKNPEQCCGNVVNAWVRHPR